MLVPEGADDPLRARLEDKFPTASVAVIELNGAWSDAGMGRGQLVQFIRPRDLDPSLGPDQP